MRLVVIQTTYCSVSMAAPRSLGCPRTVTEPETGPGRTSLDPTSGKERGMKRGLLVLTGLATAAVAAAAFVGAAGPSGAKGSSHREAPLIADDPAADNTDVYAFVSPDKPNTVTIIANYIPFEDPAGGPNYYRFDPSVRYELHVDSNGDARDDVTYRFNFKTSVGNPNTFLYNMGPVASPTDANLNVKQTYSVTRITPSGTSTLVSGAPVLP